MQLAIFEHYIFDDSIEDFEEEFNELLKDKEIINIKQSVLKGEEDDVILYITVLYK